MRVSQIREYSDEELHNEYQRLRRHIFDLNSQAVTEKLEDTTQIRKARRDVARILTVMRQRELAGGGPGAEPSEGEEE